MNGKRVITRRFNEGHVYGNRVGEDQRRSRSYGESRGVETDYVNARTAVPSRRVAQTRGRKRSIVQTKCTSCIRLYDAYKTACA